MTRMANDIHVGDVGTVYRARIMDQGGDFDPSTASVKQLIFRLPGGVVLVKDAQLDVGTGDEAGQLFLAYAVEANAGAGTPPGDFHAQPGRVRMQGYLEWANGDRYHSDEITTDVDGNELVIKPNLRSLE
jgi:hypothetical protein